MDTLTSIFTRRSIRKYDGRPIEQEKIDLLLKAAMYAPSARNKQPWHFIAVTDRETLDRLSAAHPYGKMLKEAALAIIVCGDRHIDDMEPYLVQDCSAATQNILLAAHGLGLGAVWLGMYPREKRISAVKEVLSIPGHILPVTMISLGYPAEEKAQPDRLLPDRIRFNSWK